MAPMVTFNERAAEWDTPERQERAQRLAGIVRWEIPLDESMRAIDIGAGTGLLGLALAGDVGSIVLSDPSDGMLEAARTKIAEGDIDNASTVVYDVPGEPPDGAPFDLAISLLALHHVADTSATLHAIHALLAPGGWMALADLDSEDGSFHSEDAEGIHHHGFDRSELMDVARSVGFKDVRTRTALTIEDEDRAFPVFLLIGRRA